MTITNDFSWSKSRNEEFRECQRKYFYDRYASWGGWDRHAAKETRLAYILKNLKNRWAWKGETVHHLIENILKSIRLGTPLSYENALAQLTETMRGNYRYSKSKKYLEDPKKYLGLFEHEYEKPISDAIWKKIHEESVVCLKNFYNSPLYQELLGDDPSHWLLIEDLEEFEMEGAKLFVKLDFARRSGNLIEIYDWKTGKLGGSAEAKIQMGVYAMYAMDKWKEPLENIRAYILGLTEASPQVKGEPITRDLIEETRRNILKSIEAMKNLLEDPARNIPKPREFFKFTENTRLCDSCNFYKICEKYQR
jgi:hypothetical protein